MDEDTPKVEDILALENAIVATVAAQPHGMTTAYLLWRSLSQDIKRDFGPGEVYHQIGELCRIGVLQMTDESGVIGAYTLIRVSAN